jgi:hypothetical protein
MQRTDGSKVRDWWPLAGIDATQFILAPHSATSFEVLHRSAATLERALQLR